ncbi:carbamoyl-phosphate synthase L chain, ATP binding domain-containing protein [Tricladium varicosporioides]|nr:carbamoyl-phosphate synthase L chain, ATP binding domain-containing protein [Hymenoscyphus varicosporioides]
MAQIYSKVASHPQAFTPIQKPPQRTFHQLHDESGRPIIKRLMIANRGEIACRIISTCRKLNITSIAVYSDPQVHLPNKIPFILIDLCRDTQSLHVKQADQSIPLGAIDGPEGNPHQNIKLLIKIALAHNVDAIHPGYGYLSENAEFSRQVRDAGIIFLGPSPISMAVLGDKRSAKQYLLKHAPEIPLIPGYNGPEQTVDRLLIESDRIGFPILIKASAGGGGKGMRIVRQREHLKDELGRAQSEAQRSFGSSDCILERYIQRSKHVEIQILGDCHGTVVSLMDRECSIQRRHQKVIEEAPSPWLKPALRQRMSATAISIGKLLGYESAGTVEFIVDIDTEEFFFLEVNTRIQVEHPITEETTGVDIVGLQIFVASGGCLEDSGYFRNGNAPQIGHAIECRLCAEDPSRDFMPDLGFVRQWKPALQILPSAQTEDVRFETGIATGSEVSIYFDSLLAKIVVWAPTRSHAIEKMARMLAYTVCIGVRSNQSFLQSCLLHPDFQNPNYSTSFIPDLLPILIQNPYVDNPAQIQESLSFLPSMIRREINLPATRRRRPFRNLPQNFRNQKADPASIQVDVVQIPTQPAKTIIVEWPFTRTVGAFRLVNILPISRMEAQKSIEKDSEREVKPSVQLAQSYNEISSHVRQLHNQNRSKPKNHRVTLDIQKTDTFEESKIRSWDLHDLYVSIDFQEYRVFIVNEVSAANSDVGSHQRFFAHVPALGTYIEYNLFSLLTYGESLRQKLGTTTTTSDKSPKAPMPCKVLTVVKKNGDRVKVGEIAVVVESMKMEMNILVAAEGIFNTNMTKGQAVEEGVVLFTIS